LTELVKLDADVVNTEILSTENLDDTVVLTLHIPTDLDYFKGHFDQAPILAGVVQLHWAAEYTKQYLNMATTDVMDIQVLKFQEMILPGHEVVLTLTKKSTEKVLFSYKSIMTNGDVKSHSSGRLIFAEVIIDPEIIIDPEVIIDHSAAGEA
jgi:3-hydroxymyristoyl/3-hydroxydecanoyl-(acyl carrier protein) dehydratase